MEDELPDMRNATARGCVVERSRGISIFHDWRDRIIMYLGAFPKMQNILTIALTAEQNTLLSGL